MVTFESYLFEEGGSELLDTDGTTRVLASRQGSRLNVEVESVKQRLGLRLIPLPGVPSVDTVHVNGVALDRVDTLEIGPGSDAGWMRDPDGTLRAMIHHE